MIRLANEADLPAIDVIYDRARRFMAQNGNPTQWGTEWPPKDLLQEDVAAGRLYVCVRDGTVHGAFAFLLGEDPTYRHIENGAWMSDAPYGTIHRLASDGEVHGVFRECADFCRTVIGHLRVDTHQNNVPMRRAVSSWGFRHCGVIYVGDGTPREAYEWLA